MSARKPSVDLQSLVADDEARRKAEDDALAREAELAAAKREAENQDALRYLDDGGDTVSDGRASRDAESRERGYRVGSYRPPEALPSPKPRAGWTRRWVRVSTLGDSDTRNVSARMSDGFRPVHPKDEPELVQSLGPQARNASTSEVIEVGGLMLFEAPNEAIEARQAYYDKIARGATQREKVQTEALRHSAQGSMPIEVQQNFTRN